MRFTPPNAPVETESSAAPDKPTSGPVSAASLLRDRLFVAALLIPLPLWAVWLSITGQPVDLVWPLAQPLRFTMLVLIYPVLEEIVFRGLLQDVLHRVCKSKTVGPLSLSNVLTSLVFTATHFLYHAPLWAAAVFVPSLVFGFFKDRHRRLLSPIVLHIYYNFGYFWLFGSTVS